ncbi:MAG: inositol phosphatase [Planctomycetes bacterium]|jgi:histidinol-phosphatase|nr:inositol phosphatase [Planctomycetota bacterium]MDP6423792.1 inositol monophosphatase family protein [Planctomycetota bacterium]
MSALIEAAAQTAQRAAIAAARVALPHFARGVDVEHKADDSPVTIADREAERAIIDIIRAAFPDHDVIGEETGEHVRGAQYRWYVDPIDGTRGFTRGGSFWGPLIALAEGSEVLAGALGLPVLGDVYWAGRGLGCHKNDTRLALSTVEDWSEATLSLGELRRLLAPPYRDSITRLASTAASARCYGDLASATQLLDGRAEAWVEAGVKAWDIAPMQVLVEEAGGVFRDLEGNRDFKTGTAIATNGRVRIDL